MLSIHHKNIGRSGRHKAPSHVQIFGPAAPSPARSPAVSLRLSSIKAGDSPPHLSRLGALRVRRVSRPWDPLRLIGPPAFLRIRRAWDLRGRCQADDLRFVRVVSRHPGNAFISFHPFCLSLFGSAAGALPGRYARTPHSPVYMRGSDRGDGESPRSGPIWRHTKRTAGEPPAVLKGENHFRLCLMSSGRFHFFRCSSVRCSSGPAARVLGSRRAPGPGGPAGPASLSPSDPAAGPAPAVPRRIWELFGLFGSIGSGSASPALPSSGSARWPTQKKTAAPAAHGSIHFLFPSLHQASA